jgi:hypothetical protein
MASDEAKALLMLGGIFAGAASFLGGIFFLCD